MKTFNKITVALLLSTALVGCANLDDSLKASEQNFQQYIDATSQFNVNEEWWKLYNDPQLNQLVDLALKNNLDLAKSAVAVNIALYKANLLGADLVPTFSGGSESKARKDIKNGGNSTIIHTGNLKISYTLDLWRKLADSADAAEWEHKATVEDLAAARLALINSVINTYYSLAYLNDAIKATEDSVRYYNEIDNVVQNKQRYGVIDGLSSAQAKQAVLMARNTLLELQAQQKTAQQTMHNLLNLKPTDPLHIQLPDLLSVKLPGVNLNVPVSVIANRPDVRAAEYRLQSAFKDAKAMQKSWFPQISLAGSLQVQGNKVSNATDTQAGIGTLGITLPFLSWQTVKWNVKISEANYEVARLGFEQSITNALNEIDALYFAYQQSQRSYNNLQDKYNYDKRISQYYRDRYNAGVSELKDWLTAANTEKTSQISILNQKYQLIQNETAVYQAMAGYYMKK
ncbi:toxin/drug exporter TdeA [Gallibacterium anatis]|uniref:toxin/drug exporter TdeA n=1 Tax=Gallibacterium anatis TaxID=750 RepID=UPI0039FD393B